MILDEETEKKKQKLEVEFIQLPTSVLVPDTTLSRGLTRNGEPHFKEGKSFVTMTKKISPNSEYVWCRASKRREWCRALKSEFF